jgi:ABC-2 type transport system permease protein
MNKFLRVMWHEYTRHVWNKRFLFGLLSIPILIVVIMAISIIASLMSANNAPIGYVDQSGLFSDPKPLPPSEDPFTKPVKIIPFSSPADAQAALGDEKIQAFYVIMPDYNESSNTKLFYLNKAPDSQIQDQFFTFLKTNLIASEPDAISTRLNKGTTFIAVSADGKREMGQDEWFNILIPLFAGIMFMMVIMSSGGYLMQAVVEEKENRTMEIVVTSVSPGQLMSGKIVGDMAIGLTQMAFWTLFVALGLLIGRNYVDWIRQIRIGSDMLFILLASILPSFVMIAAIMAAIGATVTETREAQQITGLFSLPIMIPYWFTFSFMTDPNGPIAVGLSYFPLTAPVALLLRVGFSQIPTGQLVSIIGLLLLCAVTAIWLAARAFRLGMLSYGKRISLRQILSKAE